MFLAPLFLAALIFSSVYQVCHGSCSSGYFECQNKGCVVLSYVCDGYNRCGDMSDENICGRRRRREEVTYVCRNLYYIAMNRVCDGSLDCNDGGDELNCGTGYCGHPGLFRCGNGLCIPNGYVCDGAFQCADKSDEQNCGSGTCNHPALFKCVDGACISKMRACDGVNHCTDASDEKDCENDVFGIPGVHVSLATGISWLKAKRNKNWGWDENTHRAIVALYLTEDATFNGTKEEEELMAKQLEVKVALSLLRNGTDPLSPAQLALYIHALLVTCHNPRKFYGFDLITLLKDQIRFTENVTHPLVFLALCNADEIISDYAVNYLSALLVHQSDYLFWTDIRAVAVMALSCVISRNRYEHLVHYINNTVSESFKKKQRTDGSFGNVYTTALVLQAILASGHREDADWDVNGAVRFLQLKQNSSVDHSFGDFLATYLVLPVLNGKSLADIAEVDCPSLRNHPKDSKSLDDLKNRLGPKSYIQYSLYIGEAKDVVHSLSLRVPANVTVYDVMRLAAEADPKYNFEYKRTGDEIYVYSIANIPNDPETGIFWLLYCDGIDTDVAPVLNKGSPDKVPIGGCERIIMWYKAANIPQ